MEKSWKKIAVRLSAIAAFILFIIFVYRCPIRLTFNIECPGCGLKRAFMDAIRFDFISAFNSHPLFPLLGAEALYVIIISLFPKLRIPKKAELTIGIVTVALLAAVWIIRKIL